MKQLQDRFLSDVTVDYTSSTYISHQFVQDVVDVLDVAFTTTNQLLYAKVA